MIYEKSQWIGEDYLKTGDQAYIKALNRRIIIETILKDRSISRAQLSKVTGLNKATITSQINELLEEGLVEETKLDKSTGGRKPILLSLKKEAGYALGIEVDVDRIYFLITNLYGEIIQKEVLLFDTTSYEKTKKILLEKIRDYAKEYAHGSYGLVGAGIGIHGLVDQQGKIIFVIHSNWRNVDLKEDLQKEIDIPIFIDNNTNYCAYGEKTFYIHTPNILCLTISTGIGLGIIMEDKIYKGFHGFAGEIGHMIIHRDGKQCTCGNLGCWEQYASERAFLLQLAELKGKDFCTVEELIQGIQQKDSLTLHALNEFAKNLSIGINNVINTFNPETIIINSHIIPVYPYLMEEIKNYLRSSMNDYQYLLYSRLGQDACTLGGSAVVIKHFLKISDLNLAKEESDF